MSQARRSTRTSGHLAHDLASPARRPEPMKAPKTKTKFGVCRCPGCEQHWSGLAWGRACPDCGTVRMSEGNWFPWGSDDE